MTTTCKPKMQENFFPLTNKQKITVETKLNCPKKYGILTWLKGYIFMKYYTYHCINEIFKTKKLHL